MQKPMPSTLRLQKQFGWPPHVRTVLQRTPSQRGMPPPRQTQVVGS
jgi:hypothetical protein